ncbi:MAG: hypothetical protein LBJ00_00560 [Planctomycetaceae bacterium]|nr:hypothetical protein [Planctomycetaceae bacterium]
MPKLYSCKITITQDNLPLEDAFVSLVPQDQNNSKWHPSGKTDSSGIAQIMTYGFSGVPVGNFKITVKKTVMEDPIYSTNSNGEKEIVDYKSVYSVIEKKYANPETTPFTVEISGVVTFDFDVGKAIKLKLKKNK